MVKAELLFLPSLTCSCRTSTSTPLVPFGIRRLVSHQLMRSNHLTGSAPTDHSLPPLNTAVGMPLLSVCTMTCSIPESYGRGLTTGQEAPNKKPRRPRRKGWDSGVCFGGSYRDRTDDIHGVNVALYQLS